MTAAPSSGDGIRIALLRPDQFAVDGFLPRDMLACMSSADNQPTAMDSDIERITNLLLEASERIDPQYFNLPIAGAEETAFKERVYCYELYHECRSRWPSGWEYSLCGETDKRGHPLVKGKHLKDKTPDFLVHTPGRMDNLLVVEVKAFGSEVKNMLIDLAKLTAFRRDLIYEGRPANYQAAFFWIYGMSCGAWPKLMTKIITDLNNTEPEETLVEPNDVQFSLIRFFIHEQPNKEAVEVFWTT